MSELEWLHRFIACTPFGADAPAEDIANAERILYALERELAEARGGLQMAYEKGQEARDAYLSLYDDMLMLANGKPLDDEADKNALVVQAQLAAARAEVEAAFRAGFSAGERYICWIEMAGDPAPETDAAWSRYQQERGKG